jgi:cellulase
LASTHIVTANEAIGGNHDGPVIVYMAKVDDYKTTTPWTASWFKIGQTGLVSKDYWGTDVLNANCGKISFKVPSDIAPGNYLLRAEVIALHVAGSVGGAQYVYSQLPKLERKLTLVQVLHELLPAYRQRRREC